MCELNSEFRHKLRPHRKESVHSIHVIVIISPIVWSEYCNFVEVCFVISQQPLKSIGSGVLIVRGNCHLVQSGVDISISWWVNNTFIRVRFAIADFSRQSVISNAEVSLSVVALLHFLVPIIIIFEERYYNILGVWVLCSKLEVRRVIESKSRSIWFYCRPRLLELHPCLEVLRDL